MILQHALPLKRGEMERTTCPKAAQWPFPPASLWVKVIAAGGHKELPLSQQGALPECSRCDLLSFLTNSLLWKEALSIFWIWIFSPLLLVTCLPFKPAPQSLKAPPFLRLAAPYHVIPLGLQWVCSCRTHSRKAQKSFCPPQTPKHCSTLESEQFSSDLFTSLIHLNAWTLFPLTFSNLSLGFTTITQHIPPPSLLQCLYAQAGPHYFQQGCSVMLKQSNEGGSYANFNTKNRGKHCPPNSSNLSHFSSTCSFE